MFHGFAAMTPSRNNLHALTLVAIGPAAGPNPGIPGLAGETCPPYGILLVVGLNPTMPLHSAGILIEPAISVPTPSTLPLIAISAPSPPVEPPAVKLVLLGFSVRPNTLFSESAVIIVCGILVLQCITAPRLWRMSTMYALLVAG